MSVTFVQVVVCGYFYCFWYWWDAIWCGRKPLLGFKHERAETVYVSLGLSECYYFCFPLWLGQLLHSFNYLPLVPTALFLAILSIFLM